MTKNIDLSASTSSIHQLFRDARDSFPISLREDGWYLTVAATLITLHRPELFAQLYGYVASLPNYSSLQARIRLSGRFRDVMLKAWTIVGIPIVVLAMTQLAAVEAEIDPALANEPEGSPLYPDFSLTEDQRSARGTAFIQALYQQNLEPIFASWGSHRRAFEWAELHIIYGLFLSDHNVLSAVETELVAMPSILAQSLPSPAIWHLRGMLRLGISREDTQGVINCTQLIATNLGTDTTNWPSLDDIPTGDI